MFETDEPLQALTRECIDAGAHAVVLFGSLARGDATPLSDIDLVLFGDGDPRYEWYAGRLLVANWTTPAAARAAFTDPGEVGMVIPGWREAHIRYDPHGIAAAIRGEAIAWTWDRLDPSVIAAKVARDVTGYAEEALKLAAAMQRGHNTMAAIQRNQIVARMAIALALHRRMLYGSENVLWDRLAADMGDPWAALQARAFGLHGEAFDDTCRAALALYALTASEMHATFDATQRRIIAAVTHAIRQP